ncbi:HHR043Cp [Eremothecium sinecaudum]|uniref:Phosphatidylserine decarboxylase proenzyme 2 n=1 Tax=Eremothecium sinecaudum TaxID=45286 RepID=A0A0X8HWL3_9SACH|nr:HHR043Cp [Eremothecium sinecaudum]AMD22812.1 HHR043Cp [Eremothecium sinecaudum]
MGLIRKGRAARRGQLSVKVDIIQAKIDTVENSRCNPLCLVTTNGIFNRSKKLRNTSNPRWEQTLTLILPSKPTSEHLRIVLYDDMLRKQEDIGVQLERERYLYLGEVRLSLLEMFKGNGVTHNEFHLPPRWYPVCNRKRKGYQAADIQVAITLSCCKDGMNLQNVYRSWCDYLTDSMITRRTRMKQDMELLLESFEGEENENDLAEFSSLSSDSLTADFTNYEDITRHSVLSGKVEEPEDEEADGEEQESEYLTDVPSDYSRYRNVQHETCGSIFTEQRNGSSGTFASVPQVSSNSLTDSSQRSNQLHANTQSSDEDTDITRLRRRLRNLRRTKRGANVFEITKKTHALGIAIVDIKNITDLPPLRNKFSTTFDMDPFVILSFGRRVFKTSWKKHSLNPEYNERAAFEIYPSELSFTLDFRVFDKDSFSYHERVADASVLVKQVTEFRRADNGEFVQELAIPLVLKDEELARIHSPKLNLKVRYVPYQLMKKRFWQHVVNSSTNLEQFDVVQLTLLLDGFGHFSDEEVNTVFYQAGKSPWSQDKVSKEEVVEALQNWKNISGFKRAKKCPLCSKQVQSDKHLRNSKLHVETDLVTHFAICSSRDRKLLKASYVSCDFASKRWFSKVLIKLTYGKYALGSNNANILVQDRDTGIVIEEKINVYVRLGIRIIYNARGKQSRKFKSLLRTVTIKQGKKFDRPSSVKDIESFIKFHSLDMSQCLDREFKTFNEFFYRKLKPGSRPPESENPKVLLSPADSRCSVFPSVSRATEFWIKGKTFTLSKLTNGYYSDIFSERTSSVGIFRLAPQDYHRFHSPCNGVVGKPKYISGEYYTVNPMAVRTELDVFGENVRVVIPIESEEFGTILYIPVGAMMVGSIILTCKQGDTITRGQELGYFKFGGSTVILVLEAKNVVMDTDLLKNSEESIETLVKVGMSIGHTPDVREYRRTKVVVNDSHEIERIKRSITVAEDDSENMNNASWEYRTLKNLNDEDPEIEEFFSILSEQYI